MARLDLAGVAITQDLCQRLEIPFEESMAWITLSRRDLNAPRSHAAGRLFDAFAALLGVAPTKVSYEGQAAVRLEQMARQWTGDVIDAPFQIQEQQDNFLVVNWDDTFQWGLDGRFAQQSKASMAFGLHRAAASAAVQLARMAADRTGETTVFLSGGVFMNRLLCDMLLPMMRMCNLIPYMHQRIPPNDNGVALGLVLMAGR